MEQQPKKTHKKRTGIFGGSFNPIHNGHVTLASRLRRAAHLDEVWLMVTPQNPWKTGSTLLADEHRLAMARLAVAEVPGVMASDYEFHLPKPSYTWDTLQALSRDFPDHTFTLLIGGDNWEKFDGWYAHEEILANYDIAVYPRKGSTIDTDALPPRVQIVRTPLIDISSTDIRERIRRGEPIDALVHPRVADLILRQGWYKE